MSPTFECMIRDDYREPMRPLLAIALTLTVFGIAACSGDDEADPTTTAAATTVTVVESTEPDDTTSTVAPTSSTSTSTSAAPTTTIDPTEALIADIEADLNTGEAALFVAGAAPSAPSSLELVRRYFPGDSLDSIEATLTSLAAAIR